MDTSRLKRFATEARNILMQGVAHRFTALGFLPDGNVTEEPLPKGGGATFMGDTVSEDFYKKWGSLQNAVKRHGIEEVAEEAAYTWFNRMVAIRIMVKNGLIAPVLQYESEGVHIPLLVSEARQGRMPDMSDDDQRKLEDLLLDDSKTDEQFRFLIVDFCHTNPVINSCFGHISDYTELLLPTNILAEGGFVDMLNNTEFISEEDYHSPELIGWLYQFYISEKKDDVFASFKKGKKAEAKDIPAATQIFTPNWIVKYMVQNTIGRIYLDNNPYEEDIQKNWKYLVEPSEPTPKDNILHYDDLKELKFADLASGSGHILNEGFDMLYDLYVLEGYSRSQAIENMNDALKGYVEDNYTMSRFDMYSVFMNLVMDSIKANGNLSMIVQPTWLVNYSFGELRDHIIDNFHIDSLLHMGRGNFGNDWGSIAFTLCRNNSHSTSKFFKLYERTFYRIEPEHISTLFLLAKENKDFRYDFASYSSSSFNPINVATGKRINYECKQEIFKHIVNAPFCYTFTDDTINIINTAKLSNHFTPATGLQAGDNSRYIRNWHEVSIKKVNKKWFPYINGGNSRRWYGNLECFVNWENDGYEIKHLFHPVTGRLRSRPQSQRFYFREGATWNRIASKGITLRYMPKGCIFDQAGDSLFADDIESVKICIAYLNSKVAKNFFDMLAPGLNLTAGTIGALPYIPAGNYSTCVIDRCNSNIAISHQDWDAHETSWDFQRNEILTMDEQVLMENLDYIVDKHYKETGEHICIDPAAPQPESVEWCYDTYCTKWERLFMQLHENEEELNRQFIDIYGLQDELTPDVPLDEITILQQGEIKIEDDQLKWNADVVMKQLISYAVGCMMGRYSIDKPGLILANQGDGLDQYNEQVPDSRFEPDDDGIIPLMSAQIDFADNATIRFKQWLVAAFGEDTLVENLNFIEKCLGKSVDDYFVKDFWKDHKKMYQNRPIYWLFSSKKGAFQCLAYMHRMDAYTAERIRTKYLLPHIEWLMQKQAEMEANAANLNARERKELDNISKQIQECREYHDRLHVIADEQIAFDLDDGVVVNYAKFGDVLSKLK